VCVVFYIFGGLVRMPVSHVIFNLELGVGAVWFLRVEYRSLLRYTMI